MFGKVGKYAFYDAVVEIAHINPVRSDAYYISIQRRLFDKKNENKEDSNTKSMVFDTRDKSNTPKFSDIFGGSTKTALKSSRRDVSYRQHHRIIAGVKVPAKPIEPDNCCMSGCINCVWELFNEDVEDWKAKRLEAAHKLLEKNKLAKHTIEEWPKDWDPPKIVQNQGSHKVILEDHKPVSMPVGLQVFAEFEKKKKQKQKQKQNAAVNGNLLSNSTPKSNLNDISSEAKVESRATV